mmetsp:Transcript_4190/g.10678  ORF Transcript_4190/g.10678 Transcript_4190/m.10678 type:complete len:534 (-) Transcript_4190:173-1774(-)
MIVVLCCDTAYCCRRRRRRRHRQNNNNNHGENQSRDSNNNRHANGTGGIPKPRGWSLDGGGENGNSHSVVVGKEEIPTTIMIDAFADSTIEADAGATFDTHEAPRDNFFPNQDDENTTRSTSKRREDTQELSSSTNRRPKLLDEDEECCMFCLRKWEWFAAGVGVLVLIVLGVVLLVVVLVYAKGGGDGTEDELDSIPTMAPTRLGGVLAPSPTAGGPTQSLPTPTPPPEGRIPTPQFPTPEPTRVGGIPAAQPTLPPVRPTPLGQEVYSLRVHLHESAAVSRSDLSDTFQARSATQDQILPMKYEGDTDYTTLLVPGSYTFELFDASILARDVFANDNKGGYLELQIDDEPIWRVFMADFEANGGAFTFDVPFSLPYLEKPTSSPTLSAPPTQSPTHRPTPAPTPSPTSMPSPSPTLAPTGVCETALPSTTVTRTLTITFQNPEYPGDNSFQLQEICGRLPLIDYGSQPSGSEEYTEELRASLSYKFEVFDVFGDGFDSFFDSFLELRLDGELIWRLEDFGEKAEFVFEVPE